MTKTTLEAKDGSWWAMVVGSNKKARASAADLSSIVGPVRINNAKYAPRWVGYGVLPALLPGEVLGTDEGSGQPILSESCIERLGSI